jgi:hypothetical protein
MGYGGKEMGDVEGETLQEVAQKAWNLANDLEEAYQDPYLNIRLFDLATGQEVLWETLLPLIER